MLKRLIEVALPLKEVSEQSAREKSIRHGHISTLHIWWARRPLAACRAAVFASLIPDPDDPECPDHFRALVMEALGRTEFKPKNGDGSAVEDTPRNRCLEFIKQLVKWENSNNQAYIDPARTLISAAHKFLHPDAEGDAPKVLDPFAGGGAIPLEALRLGCEAHAIDINPVAHLIELCTLVYPQKYGQPNSRPVPEYIKQLIAYNEAKKRAKGELGLFDDEKAVSASDDNKIIPDVEITEAEYYKNPLVADVKYWGHWVLEKTYREIGSLFPIGRSGAKRLAYIWAHTLPCPNPACRATVPLFKQRWLAHKPKRRIAFDPVIKQGAVTFQIVSSPPKEDDPSEGTIRLGAMRCPVCQQGMYDKSQIKEAAKEHGLGLMPVCVVTSDPTKGRHYELFDDGDMKAFSKAKSVQEKMLTRKTGDLSVIPDEDVGRDFEWVLKPPMFGLTKWRDQHNPRQSVAIATFASNVRSLETHLNSEYAVALQSLLTLVLGRLADKSAIQCRWHAPGEKLENVFGRQAIPMSWDYGELNPFSGAMGDWLAHLDWVMRAVAECSIIHNSATVRRSSATKLPIESNSLQALFTDPPYYDAVPYSDLSDFFYVWHKRCLQHAHPELYRTPLTPKAQELVQQSNKVTPAAKRKKTKEFFEEGMQKAFGEMNRTLTEHGVCGVMFAHKSTSAWEALIQGLIHEELQVTASWPIHTEMKARLRASQSAALASSILLICRPRYTSAGSGLWDDVRQELKSVAQERLDFFWDQGIRGADFFISAIGPALSVFGKYERVTKLSGEEVTVGQFLDEVRGLVTSYALAKILKATHTGTIDPESRFYVVWKWSYRDRKVPADESFKLSQALGFDTASLWDRTGVLEKSGENVQASAISKRIKVKNLGEPSADGTPASLIDALHRMCAFREKGDTQGMGEFLGRSGHTSNNSLWLVAQAVSEILPDGDKEKQLMQGLLNQKDGLEEAARERKLF